jgi:hypothetical protein
MSDLEKSASNQPTVKQPPIKVEAFRPAELPVFKDLMEYNKLYFGICQQQEKIRIGLTDISKKLRELKTDRNPDLLTPWGGGLYKRITQANKKELIQHLSKRRQQIESQYKDITEQRRHRADELGEKRLNALRLLFRLLKEQHDFEEQELIDILTEKKIRLKED